MPRDEKPILEHPTGEFASAKEAVAEAIKRIRATTSESRWAVLTGQGQGARVDAYRFVEVRIRADVLDFGEPVPGLLAIAGAAGLEVSRLEPGPNARTVRLPGASPGELAQLADAVFRTHFKVRPHAGEQDYAFGAEWGAPGSPSPPDHAAKIAAVIDLATRRRSST